MTGKQKAELIRQGNACFNDRRIKEAVSFFVKAEYKDGLARIGDYFFYEMSQPLKALPFYRKAEHKAGYEAIYQKMAMVLQKLLYTDELGEDWDQYLTEQTELLDKDIQDQKQQKIEERKQHLQSDATFNEQTQKDLIDGGFGSIDFSTKPLSKGKVTELEKLRNKLKSLE